MKLLHVLVVAFCCVVSCPSQVVVQRRSDPPPFDQMFWQLPIEAMAARADRPTQAPWAFEVFEAEHGTQGYFIFSKQRKLHLRLRTLDGQWHQADLPSALPSAVTQRTKYGLFLTASLEDEVIRYHEWNLWDNSEHRVTEIPNGTVSVEGLMFPCMVVDGDSRHALCVSVGGLVVFATSSNGGVDWTPLEVIARNARDKDQICPPLMATSSGLHVVHVAQDGMLTHIISDDRGANWGPAKAQPDWQEQFGEALTTNGYSTRDVMHICTVTKSGKWIFHASNDAGASWTDGVEIAACKPSMYSSIFQVRGNGKTTVLCYTEPGDKHRHARRARFLRTSDGGKTWGDLPVVEGVKADTGRPIIYVSHRGRILSAFVKGPAEGDDDDKDYYVLLRGLAPIDKSQAMGGAQRVHAMKLVQDLLGADAARQASAKEALAAMGKPVVPILLDAVAKAEAGQGQEAARGLIRDLELRWDRQSEVPPWWVGSSQQR